MFKNEPGESGNSVETLIGEKTKIKGDVNFSGGLHIDGEVEGSVTAADGAGIVHLSESAKVTGELTAPIIVVNGEVDGDVHADERLELRENARVSGNIHYQAIEMRLGAEVNGQLLSKTQSRSGATSGNLPGNLPEKSPVTDSGKDVDDKGEKKASANGA